MTIIRFRARLTLAVVYIGCALLLPRLSDCEVHAVTVLMVTNNNGSLTSEESARRTQFQNWGYTVTTVWDNAAQAIYDTALASAHVVYVSEEVSDGQVSTKLRLATIGVVSEDRNLDNEIGFTTSNGGTSDGTQINLTDNSHAITSGLSTGNLTLFSSSQQRTTFSGTVATGYQQLTVSSSGALGVVETGAALANTSGGNSTASGRRVRLPWGGNSFTFSALNSNGLNILQRAIAWASNIGPLVGHWKLNEISGTTATDSAAYGYSGTYSGGVTLNQTGPYFGAGAIAANFDGVNDGVDASVVNISAAQSRVSVAAWVYVDTYVNNAAILENGSSSNYVALNLTSAGNFRLQWAGDSVTSSATVPLGTWTHLAATYDGTNVRLYMNGQLITTNAKSINWGTFTGALTIGYSPIGTTEYFDGKLFDVRLYNTNLTDEQVTDLYGLVGHWALDETSGTTASDETPYLNHGTYSGGVTINQSGPYGGATAAEFDGSDDLISIADDAALKPTSSLSIAGWVRGDAWSSGDSVDTILRKGEANPNNYQFAIADGQASFYLDANDGAGVRSTTTLYTGQWYHVAATWDGSTVRIYVNGVLETTQARTGTIGIDTRTLYIGGRPGSDQFDGRLDDVRLYNRALSAEEVALLSASGSGLIAHWTFDDATGVAVLDSSGNNRHAAFNTGTPAWITTCSSDAYLQFNGSNDADTNSSFDPPAIGSVAFWYRDDSPHSTNERLFGLSSDWEVRMIDGRLRFDIAIVDGFDGPAALANDENWHHVVVRYNSTADTYALYIDGEFSSSGSLNFVDVGAAVLNIGSSLTNTSQKFSGALNDLRIYNYELSDEEIIALSGVIGHWRLDETTGAVASDSSLAGHHGAYVGSPTLNLNGAYVPKTLRSVEFNGTSQSMTTGASLLNNLAQFTIAGWVRLDQVGNQTSFFGQNELAEIGIKYGTNRIHFWTANGGEVNVTGELPVGQWTHIAAVGSGSGLRLYVNGIEVGSNGNVVANYGASAYHFKVGEGVYESSGNYFDGRVDDVRVYGKALCPDEVNALYKGGRPSGVRIIEWLEVR